MPDSTVVLNQSILEDSDTDSLVTIPIELVAQPAAPVRIVTPDRCVDQSATHQEE